ncbi:hypothetical protein LCGC14_1882840, partial [marine sediment metagenome]
PHVPSTVDCTPEMYWGLMQPLETLRTFARIIDTCHTERHKQSARYVCTYRALLTID